MSATSSSQSSNAALWMSARSKTEVTSLFFWLVACPGWLPLMRRAPAPKNIQSGHGEWVPTAVKRETCDNSAVSLPDSTLRYVSSWPVQQQLVELSVCVYTYKQKLTFK